MRRVLWLCLSAVLMRAAAGAEPTPEQLQVARRLFAEAEADEASGRWQRAAEKLAEITTIKDTAGVRFHLGYALEKLGRLKEALEAYRRAAELADAIADAREREALRRRAAREAAAIEARLPTVEVVAPGAVSVRIDGDESATRVRVPINPGEHRIAAVNDRGVQVERSLVAMERGEYTVMLEFPAPAASVSMNQTTTRQDRARKTVPTGAYVAGGVALALAATSAFYFRKQANLEDETTAVCRTHPQCDPRRKTVAKTYGEVALGAAVGATVALGVGIVLVVHYDRNVAALSWQGVF